MDERKEMYERKANYVAKMMRANAEVETLTEEQHEALAELARVRHEIHTSWEDIFNGNTDVLDELEAACEELTAQDLGEPALPALDLLASSDDYYELLDSDERAEYEAQAEKLNASETKLAFHASGFDMWREAIYDFEFAPIMEDVNTAIEKYLAEIDKKHGTDYCPTGASRLY